MDKQKFKVTWEVEDRCVIEDSIQHFDIHSDEIEADMNINELKKLFYDLLYQDFQSKVEPGSKDLESFIEWSQKIISLKNQKCEEEDED